MKTNYWAVFLASFSHQAARKITIPKLKCDNCVTNRLRTRKIALTAALLTVFSSSGIIRAEDNALPQTHLMNDGIMVRIPVNVFGKTLYFIVDTGCSISAIDCNNQSSMGKQVGNCIADTPLGNQNQMPLFNCPDIEICGKPFLLNKIGVLDLHMARLISGQPCDGILGMDFFARQVVELDFDHKTCTLLDAVPQQVKDHFIAVPVAPIHQQYQAQVLINNKDTLDLMIDTGDNSSISLNAQAWQEIFSLHPAKSFAAIVSGAGNHIAQSEIGVVDNLNIQGIVKTNLHVMRIRNPADPSHLGLGYLKRNNVVFDFPERKIFLQPRQNFFNEDKEDMSGLHLLREGDETVVYSVDPNSPAGNSGIKAHDILISINGQNSTELTLRMIRQILKHNPGDLIKLRVQRKLDSTEFDFVLKQII